MELLNTFLISKKIAKETKILSYFIHHLTRCKNTTDEIKLTVIIVTKVSFIAELVKLINKENEQLVSGLIKTKYYE